MEAANVGPLKEASGNGWPAQLTDIVGAEPKEETREGCPEGAEQTDKGGYEHDMGTGESKTDTETAGWPARLEAMVT